MTADDAAATSPSAAVDAMRRAIRRAIAGFHPRHPDPAATPR